jgi:hypothetical protein
MIRGKPGLSEQKNLPPPSPKFGANSFLTLSPSNVPFCNEQKEKEKVGLVRKGMAAY